MIDDEPPDPNDFTDSSPCPANDAELAAQCELLHQHGIQKVTIQYEGSGDSGGIEHVELEPSHIKFPTAIQHQFWDLAEGFCPDGYENNDGGYGTLTLFITLGCAQLEHTDRYEDTESLTVQPASLPDDLKQSLATDGVIRLTASFDGSGDSGQIETVTVEPEGIEISDALWDKLDDFLLELLPGGWEINEGSFGQFDIDVGQGQVTVDASWRIASETNACVTRWKWRK
jgi:hypothetical protein